MHCTTCCEDPRSIATNPVLLTNSITSCLASVSSPDVKMTVRGLFGEKSCIQAIGMLLIDFTSRAPTAISATISLDVRPLQRGPRSGDPRQTDIGFRIHMRVRRIDQDSATPIDTFQRFSALSPNVWQE